MHHQVLPFDEPAFYLSKHLKKTDPDGLNKTKYARIVGALFYQSGCYAVYNLRDALMKWKPESELKSKLDLTDICTMNTSNKEVNSVIFFGASYQTGLRMLQEWKSNRDNRKLFTSVYQHVHFIPIDDFRTDLLRIITLPDWNDQLSRSRIPAPHLLLPSGSWISWSAPVKSAAWTFCSGWSRTINHRRQNRSGTYVIIRS